MLPDPLADLSAEGDCSFGALTHTGKEAVLISASEQGGTEVMDVFVDDVSNVALQRI